MSSRITTAYLLGTGQTEPMAPARFARQNEGDMTTTLLQTLGSLRLASRATAPTATIGEEVISQFVAVPEAIPQNKPAQTREYQRQCPQPTGAPCAQGCAGCRRRLKQT